ncbi:hypothetical protein SELMODRAFT_425539 [Selaginella moellendorffii]|uniref:Crinkler (CRN) family protein n=1 Tax=Selaginella moellendorffii TaxID=88036 RepID=D8STF5_SELML|nr:hypothetical protein SELMODRAFT_425539 [Selaginella moellendorffii]
MPGRFQRFHDSMFISFEGGKHRVLDPVKNTLVGSFFQIKLGGSIRDVPESLLMYVRQDLVDLYDALLADIADGEDTRRVYIGHPGTGKSLTAIQLLFLLLKRHSANPVVYYSHKVSQGVYHLFKGGQFHSLLRFDAVAQYLEDPDTFYIHDGSKIPDSGAIEARTVLVTCPKANVYKEFAKVSGGYDAFYGHLWTEEELKACRERSYSRIPWQTVARHVYMAGPIPRLVFQTAEKFKTVVRTLKSKLAQTSDLLSVFSSIRDHDLEQSFSHDVVLHLDRGKDSSEGYTKIASDYVKEQLLLRLDKEKWLEMIDKYTSLQGIGGLTCFRGTVLELLMHITFPRFLGKCERICSKTHRHSTSAPARMNVDEAEDIKVVFYVNYEDLQAKIEKCIGDKCAAAYFWPRTRSEAAIDSIYIDFKRKQAYLLQATVSKKHVVVWHPVKLLMEFLSSKAIRIAGFRTQRWRKTREVKGEYPEVINIPSLCQYKLEFSVLDDDWKNIEKLSDTLRNMDDNFKLTLSLEKDLPEEHVQRRRSADDSSSSSVTIEPECELEITEVDVAAGELYEQDDEE